MQQFSRNFTNSMILYGMTRKTLYLKDATTNEIYYNKKTNSIEEYRMPVFITDKIGIIIICGFASTYLWPYYMYQDIRNFEISTNPTKSILQKEKNTLLEHFIN